MNERCRRGENGEENSPVNVTHDGDWCRNMDDVGLSHEDFFGFFADLAQECFMEKLFTKELFYTRVEVEWSHFGDNN